MSRELEELIRRLTIRVNALEDRHDKVIRHGKVTDVDPKKHLARIEIGKKDGKVVKSPWVPYAQFSGPNGGGDDGGSGGQGGGDGGGEGGGDQQQTKKGAKYHTPPFVGQQMSLFSPNGEFRQGMILPFTWYDKAKSPSDSGDEHVTRWDQLRELRKKDQLILSVGAQKDGSDQGGDAGGEGGGGGDQEGGNTLASIDLKQSRMLLRVGEGGGDYTRSGGTGADADGDQGTQRASLLIQQQQLTHKVGENVSITQTDTSITLKAGDSSLTVDQDFVEMKHGDASVKVNAGHAHLKFGGMVYWVNGAGTWYEPEPQESPDGD